MELEVCRVLWPIAKVTQDLKALVVSNNMLTHLGYFLQHHCDMYECIAPI